MSFFHELEQFVHQAMIQLLIGCNSESAWMVAGLFRVEYHDAMFVSRRQE